MTVGKCFLTAHPHIHKYSDIFHGIMPPKCSSIGRFKKVIVLLRDPFDSIWSEYQRRLTGGKHNRRIPRDKNGKYLIAWRRLSNYLAAEYEDMWNHNYIPLMQDTSVQTIFVHYEDLKNASIRIQELQRMIEFIGLSVHRDKVSTFCCAFLSAESALVHRPNPSHSNMFVTKEEVYTKEIVCHMWKNYLEKYSSIGNFRIYKNYTCTT